MTPRLDAYECRLWPPVILVTFPGKRVLAEAVFQAPVFCRKRELDNDKSSPLRVFVLPNKVIFCRGVLRGLKTTAFMTASHYTEGGRVGRVVYAETYSCF